MESIWMGISPGRATTRVVALAGPHDAVLKAQLRKETPTVTSRQHQSRVVTLPGEQARYVRLRPVEPRKVPHFLSEVAFFEHPIALPPLTSRSSEAFYSALERPAIAGVISGLSHPGAGCPAERPSTRAP